MSQSPPRPGSAAPEALLPHAKEVFRNAYFTVFVEERLEIVHTQRGGKPFDSLREVESCFTEMGAALDALERPRHALLADLRAAPGRNDPAFEATMLRMLPRWVDGFRKVGIYVRTAVGAMQIQRHAKQDGIKRWTFTNQAELMNFLTRRE
jgi:hypothetical protein